MSDSKVGQNKFAHTAQHVKNYALVDQKMTPISCKRDSFDPTNTSGSKFDFEKQVFNFTLVDNFLQWISKFFNG